MTAQRVTVQAPAKINWTLEVLGKRPDGYHEIRSIMQTIDVNDTLVFDSADELTIAVEGDDGLADAPGEQNLAFRAAELLRGRAGHRAGAHIRLTKSIPVAAGLGGGSSDAAATLRGLRALWEVDISDEELAEFGARLGSDVPFFLRGGTALVSGRGEVIDPLPDAHAPAIGIVSPPPRVVADKTARMYAALRPEYYTDGSRTEALAERIRRDEPVRDEDCFNVFEAVLAEVDPKGAVAFDAARDSGRWPHLCGSGPAFFTLGAGGARTRTAAEATRLSEVSSRG